MQDTYYVISYPANPNSRKLKFGYTDSITIANRVTEIKSASTPDGYNASWSVMKSTTPFLEQQHNDGAVLQVGGGDVRQEVSWPPRLGSDCIADDVECGRLCRCVGNCGEGLRIEDRACV